MPPRPVFKSFLQVGLVVNNLNEAMKRYWEDLGIGPWAIYTMDSSNVKNMRIRNQKVDYAMRVGFCTLGGMQWELIEPLDDQSIYAEFLKKHGPGLHHVAVTVEDYDQTIAFLRTRGIDILQAGTTKDGMDFAYLDTQAVMSCITEIYKIPPQWKFPPPEEIYPSLAEQKKEKE
jgi:hypothetical protein